MSAHTRQARPQPEGDPLGDGVDTIPGIGPQRVKLLAKMGIATIGDLVFHFPRRYDDRRAFARIAEVSEGDTVSIEATVVDAKAVRMRGRMNLCFARFRDDTGEINATWFGRGFLANAFEPGTRVVLSGEVGKYKGLALKNPDYEILGDEEEDRIHTGRVVPIYRLSEKLSQRMLRAWIHAALEGMPERLHETLPASLRERYGFPEIARALYAAHFPERPEDAKSARRRFIYEELLGIQLGVLHARAVRREKETGHRHVTGGPLLRALKRGLPFKLTKAQVRALGDIFQDMMSPRPMARLIQGDVGSGKTILAVHALVAAIDGGYQAALMAPTEILAEQHARTLRALLGPIGIQPMLLTGSTAGAKAMRKSIAAGETRLVVGTHALIQESVAFAKLGLLVVDEQHRFGVGQREGLAAKGLHPDLLHMTATPIPRTLTQTLYGAMDLSVIDELPPGRLPVKTRYVSDLKLEELYRYVADQASEGLQTFIVCPLVEDSDTRRLKSVTRHFEELSEGPLAGVKTELVHGRMKGEEKDAVMQRFKEGSIDVLFSTTVIEVGIDVPTATTIVIEDAGSFGLTQLHQLRGRVGRSEHQSHCFLLGEPSTDDGQRRIEVMCETTDGFVIAEEDLKLRGPGEFHGVRQSGLSDLRVADLVRDARVLDRARRDAEELLRSDRDAAEDILGRIGSSLDGMAF